MSDSVFTQIINREIPSHIIYEDEDTIAFLDIHGTSPGHTLVVPKRQVDHLWDLSDEEYQKLMLITKKIAVHLREKLAAARVGVKVMGEEVPHVHIHLIPYSDIAEYNSSPAESVMPNHKELAALAKTLTLKELS